MKWGWLLSFTLLTACGNRVCTPVETPCQMTLGVVQRDIFEGMSQEEVAIALGSPNIVTKDKEGQETWIYDKIASVVETRSRGYSFILFGGSNASTKTSQSTLTVVIKFDQDGKLNRVTYHASKF